MLSVLQSVEDLLTDDASRLQCLLELKRIFLEVLHPFLVFIFSLFNFLNPTYYWGSRLTWKGRLAAISYLRKSLESVIKLIMKLGLWLLVPLCLPTNRSLLVGLPGVYFESTHNWVFIWLGNILIRMILRFGVRWAQHGIISIWLHERTRKVCCGLLHCIWHRLKLGRFDFFGPLRAHLSTVADVVRGQWHACLEEWLLLTFLP